MMKELVLMASGKTTAKMLEEANERLELADSSLKAAGFTKASPANQWKPPVGASASPLLQRIDDLSTQRDELLAAMRQTLAMLRTTSHGPSAANKAEEMLHEAICSLGADHFPDAAKMVPEVCHALMTLDEAIDHANEKSIGSSQCAAQHAQLAKWLTDYRAMLVAAPKHEGGAS